MYDGDSEDYTVTLSISIDDAQADEGKSITSWPCRHERVAKTCSQVSAATRVREALSSYLNLWVHRVAIWEPSPVSLAPMPSGS
jgi:hypothetical protein